ncbi:polysaccharide deacetylase family protein [Kitasatospora sp. NPDC001175]|uniref:polysaccharide deacetylase family protein n=1 Tax=Kitasatospora sp. NPDC001175 TaxID=3157103 RepID=UPI003CFDC8F5
MAEQRAEQPGDQSGLSRRRLIRLTAAGAAALGAGGALTACSSSSGNVASAPPPPSDSPSDGFSPAAATEPPNVSNLPNPSSSPVPVRTKPVFKVHDLLPSAPSNAVALTLDDGPSRMYTPEVLQLLRKYDVRATFSVVGIEAHADKDLIRRIAADGHTIANHTMTHPQPFSRRSAAQIQQQIADTQSVIVDAGAPEPKLFRSPGGDWSADVFAAVAKYGMTPIDWDVDPKDWARPGTKTITEKLLAAKPGDILLCHDGGGNRSQTVDALRTVLPALKAKGYTFVTL